ncbi:MAG: hypothetical protein EB084_25275, partial [Proteobacteria bacterium]|nr:hypothetical protein [Pseudomonadota bacterium]
MRHHRRLLVLFVVAVVALLVLRFHSQASARAVGANAGLEGWRPFPDDNPWNQRVDGLAVDPRSDDIIRRIGANAPLHADFGASWDGGPFGIPYVVVPSGQPRVPVVFNEYGDESDPGPYPIPPDAPVEKGSDRHVLVVDPSHQKLYELYHAERRRGPNGVVRWAAGSGAVFDLSSNRLRPSGWTSADAAGLPIFPGLARYDEVVGQREIRHALRFTVSHTRRAYLPPATHFASSDADALLPPMGMRVRLKRSFDVSGYPSQARVVLVALQRYGMIVADNGS